MEIRATAVHAIQENSAQFPERPAIWTWNSGKYQATSWKSYATMIRQFTLGLRRMGFVPGETFAICSGNRLEVMVAEMGAMAVGAKVVLIDPDLNAVHVAERLKHCEARWLLLENSGQWLSLNSGHSRMLPVPNVLIQSGVIGSGTMHFDEVLQSGKLEDDGVFWRLLGQVSEDSVAMLAYVPWEKDKPRAVMLSHRNLRWAAQRLFEAADLRGEEQIFFCHSSLSRINEQLCCLIGPALEGSCVFLSSGDHVSSLKEVRPSALFAVPHFWEVLRAQIEKHVARLSWAQRRMLSWAREAALERNRYELSGERAPIDLEARFELARRLSLQPIKNLIGLDRARFLVAGAASIERELLEFFSSFDLVIREEYGQTECTGPIAMNTPDDTRWGTVGFPIPGIELRIDEEGEIQVRGPNVSLGYFKDEKATATLIRDGWLMTGDFGEFDDAGHLRLFGRRRDFLVTSSGRKVSRQPIEIKLSAIEPIAHAILIGEGRDYLVALLSLSPSRWENFAHTRGLPKSLKALASDSRFLDYLNEQIARTVNAERDGHEHVVRFQVLPTLLAETPGCIDASGQVVRQTCIQLFSKEIEALYKQARPQELVFGV